jgi:uncharacterized protein
MREQIFTFGQYLHRKFGVKVSKVPVSISGFTCPNIDGTVAKGGCTFCENDSFSPSLDRVRPLKGFFLNLNSTANPYLEKQLEQLEWQFNALSQKLREKTVPKNLWSIFKVLPIPMPLWIPSKRFMKKHSRLDNVVGISIGTRSDSINDETFRYLVRSRQKTEVWVEFGIQSIYDETLERINRGHDSANVKEAILKAKSYGLNVCGHLIFGLPSEDKEMMLETAKVAYALGIDSVKYHPLYVVKRTALANEYARGAFEPIHEELYLEVLKEALVLKPAHVSVQRLSAGIDDESLIAPLWCKDKNSQIRSINAVLKEVGFKY